MGRQGRYSSTRQTEKGVEQKKESLRLDRGGREDGEWGMGEKGSMQGEREGRNKEEPVYYQTIVVAAAFVANSFCGLSLGVGVYYVTFLQAFRQSSGETALIGSLNFGALCAAGPIGSILVNRYSVRVAIIVGGLISSAGLFTSAFAPNLYSLFATFGIITGFGFGLAFTAAVVVINMHVTSLRGLANGIAISGIGMGAFCHPLLQGYFIERFGWRGALLVASALNLHTCVAGALIRPVRINNNSSVCTKNGKVVERRRKLLRLKMFRNYEYWLLNLNCLLFCFGLSVVCTHISAFAQTIGYTPWQGTTLISGMGFANLIGRIILGGVISMAFMSVHVLFGSCYVVSGMAAIVVTSFTSYPGSLTCMCVFGFAFAAYGPVLAEMTLITVGMEYYPSAYGITLIPQALGTIFGAPIAGWLYDATHVYAMSFYLGGAALVASGFVVMIPPLIDRFSGERNKRSDRMDNFIEDVKVPVV